MAMLPTGPRAKQRRPDLPAPLQLSAALDTWLPQHFPTLTVCRLPWGRHLVLDWLRKDHAEAWEAAAESLTPHAPPPAFILRLAAKGVLQVQAELSQYLPGLEPASSQGRPHRAARSKGVRSDSH
jgi:hypothetical protein